MVAVVQRKVCCTLIKPETLKGSRESAHRNPRGKYHRTTRGRAFFLKDVTLRDGPISSAPLFMPMRRYPTLFRQDPVPPEIIFPFELVIQKYSLTEVVRQLRIDPGPDTSAKLLILVGIMEVHNIIAYARRFRPPR